MAKRYKFSQDAEEIQGLLNKIDSLDLNQQCRCSPSCELENIKLDNVVYSVITRAVSNLINYYTKSEVDTKLSSIHQFVTRQVDVLPTPSASTMYALYFVPSENRSAGNVTDEFITITRNGSYVWEQIGASPVDLSGYVTDDELNSILSDYVSSDDFSNAISELSSRIDGLHEVKYTEQQLTNAQKSQARDNIGATAPEVFWAVYDETPYAEVINAYNSGKLCACLYQGHIYYLSAVRINQAPLADIAYFDELGGSFNNGSTTLTIFVRADNSWDDETGYYVVGEDDATTWNEKYTKPSTGIPASDLADGVIPNVSQFITKTVNDLVNYYTKSETYTKAEVQALIAAINQFHYEVYASLSDVTDPHSNVLYLIGPTGTGSDKYEEYVFTTEWVKIGDTSINLSGYVTIEALNTALAGLNDVKYTAQSLTDSQKLQARTNIGATAPEVFWAEYGVTTATEIVAAFNAEKIILVKQAGFVYLYSGEDDTNYNFSCSYASIQYRLVRLNKNNNSWSVATNGVQITSSRVSTIAGNETNTALYPNTKAVADAIEAGKQIFWATYGETTATEVAAKVTAGVVVLCLRSNIVYSVTSLSSGDYITFGAIFGGSSYYLLLKKTDDTWQSGSNALENTSNKTGDIDGNKTSTTKYPTVKAVYDVVVEATDEEIDEMMESVLN